MFSKIFLVSVLAAISEARFGQEQVPIPAIQAITEGPSGAAATLAGSSISTLLAGTNACAKLQQADQIVAQLGTTADVIKAAKGLVAAEKNFNPFSTSIPSICSDPTLPTTAALRGVVPLIDPSVVGAAEENANSAASLTTPFDATGLSVAQIMAAHGFTNFTAQALDAPSSTSSSAAAAAATANLSSTSSLSSAVDAAAATAVSSELSCGGPSTFVTVTVTAAATAAATASTSVNSNSNNSTSISSGTSSNSTTASSSNSSSVATSSIAGLDFGLCAPTMKFEPGLDGRSDTEFTFQAIDPLVNKGQQEALNPNIISNRICDQLTNVCAANAAAKSACATAKANMLAAGTRNASTADAWNTELGFAGTNLNPDGAPKANLVGHT